MSGTTTQGLDAQAILSDEALAEERLLEELENGELPADIRDACMSKFKQQTINYQEMKSKQHGKCSEIAEEKDFLSVTTSEENCVVHFFHGDFRTCAIMDTHINKLSEKYFETKFAKINVDNAKFFVEKLKIRILPAVICFKNGIVVDRIIGFEELGNSDGFQTEVLERRLGKSGVIDTSGLEDEDDLKKKSIFGFRETKQDSDSDDDW